MAEAPCGLLSFGWSAVRTAKCLISYRTIYLGSHFILFHVSSCNVQCMDSMQSNSRSIWSPLLLCEGQTLYELFVKPFLGVFVRVFSRDVLSVFLWSAQSQCWAKSRLLSQDKILYRQVSLNSCQKTSFGTFATLLVKLWRPSTVALQQISDLSVGCWSYYTQPLTAISWMSQVNERWNNFRCALEPQPIINNYSLQSR